jgi:HEAT repeat protein
LAFTAAGAGLFLVSSARRPRKAATATAGAPTASVLIDDASSQAVLDQGLRNSDPRAMAVLQQRLAAAQNGPRKPLTNAEGLERLETLSSLRAGYLAFAPMSRATASIVAASILDQFSVEPAPKQWLEALQPIHDVFSASLEDADGIVRNVALNEVRRFWVWMPGRSLTPIEEQALADWKEKLHRPVVRCLANPDSDTRVAAINTLGYLPVDVAAAPAVAYLADPSINVRRQVLLSFTGRPRLLTDDMLLKAVHDVDDGIREAAKTTLKVRGLSDELISLGSLMTSPKADQRASVIALVKDRTDIDPIVWLLQLSRDADESVRLHAVKALADSQPQTVAVKLRIVEMARTDGSQQVRDAAAKLLPSAEETTASLPPLPGSSMLNPKAN